MKDINSSVDMSSVIKLNSSSILQINSIIENFDTNKFSINILSNNGFKIDISYCVISEDDSYELWSYPKSIFEFENELQIISKNFIHLPNIKIKFKLTNISEKNQYFKNQSNLFNTIPQTNITQAEIVIDKIEYDGCSLIDDITIISVEETINLYPTFNLYNNQQVTINRWLQECVAVNNRVGHHCIYFKTEVNDTINTLNSIESRDVNSIKRIVVSVPDNELPTDRVTFSEWDIPMMEDFIIHIPDLLFKNIFGNEIPSNEDFIYFPILNKLYSINTVQPGGRYMGQTGWWECYLIKFEDDELVSKNEIRKNPTPLQSNPNSILAIQNVINTVPNIDDKDISELYSIFENVSNNDIVDTEYLGENTVEEKKLVTDNFSNRLIDSTHYVDLKETDYQREKYHQRLKIITINPDSLSFPLNVYDASNVEQRIIALTYNLNEATKINKFERVISNTKPIKLRFDFVMLKRFNSDIFDIVSGNVNVFNLSMRGKSFILTFQEKEYKLDYKFIENVLYQIELTNTTLSIFDSSNLVYKLEFNELTNYEFNTTELIWYGGNYYFGNTRLFLNDNQIINDKNLPVLIMNQFGKI